MLGHGDRAFKLYKKTAPAYREDMSDLHKMEPYVYAQMIAGKDAPRFGQAKNSWLTGAAAWNYYVITQYILGVKPDYKGLRIDPCIPEDWREYTVRRAFRKAVYNIHVSNETRACRGVKSITVDGQRIEGTLLPLFNDGEHRVEVVL